MNIFDRFHRLYLTQISEDERLIHRIAINLQKNLTEIKFFINGVRGAANR